MSSKKVQEKDDKPPSDEESDSSTHEVKKEEPPSDEESDSSTHEVKKEEPDSEDDDKDKSPKILYVRCGKCRTYWPGGKEIMNHTCVLHPYKRVAFDPAEDTPDTVRCLCGELNPTERHYASCYYCTVCGRWAHGRGQHNKYCQTSKRGNREENPKKKCCPYCGDWIFKSSYARHVKNKHPDKYERKSFPKGTPRGLPTRRSSGNSPAAVKSEPVVVKKESPDVKPAKVTSKKKGVRDQKQSSKTSPAATKSPGSPKLQRKRPSSKTSPAVGNDSKKKAKMSTPVSSPSGTGQPQSGPSSTPPGEQNFFAGAARTAAMFEAMQAKYPNLNLPIPRGVMSGTQRATRSLTRQVTAAAAAEETADDHLETAETDEGDEAIDTPAEHTAETDEGGEAIDTDAQAKKTDEDQPSTPAQARKATSRKRKSHSRTKSVSKKAKSKQADAVTEAEDATVEDANEGEGENEDIVLNLTAEPEEIVDKLTSDVEHKVPTGTDEQEPEEVVDQLTSDVEHKVPTDNDDQEAKPEVDQSESEAWPETVFLKVPAETPSPTTSDDSDCFPKKCCPEMSVIRRQGVTPTARDMKAYLAATGGDDPDEERRVQEERDKQEQPEQSLNLEASIMVDDRAITDVGQRVEVTPEASTTPAAVRTDEPDVVPDDRSSAGGESNQAAVDVTQAKPVDTPEAMRGEQPAPEGTGMPDAAAPMTPTKRRQSPEPMRPDPEAEARRQQLRKEQRDAAVSKAPASPEEFRLAPEAQARQLARKKEEKAQLLATRTSPDTFVPERTSPVNRENMLQPTKLDFTPIQIRTITRNDENITEVNTMSAPGVTTTVASEVAQGQRGEVQTTIYETKVKQEPTTTTDEDPYQGYYIPLHFMAQEMSTPEGSADNPQQAQQSQQPVDFPPAILAVPAPRDFIKGYKLGNIAVADALIPANLPPDALEIIGRGLRYLGAEDDDFSGIHFAYASGQIPGSVFNYIHQKMQKPTSKVAQWYKVLFLTYMAYKHFQAKYPDSNQKKK